MAKVKYPHHARAVAMAATQLGVEEQPNGSNSGPKVVQYQRATWLGGTGWPWCAAFCCWVWEHSGFQLNYKGAGAYKWYDEGAKFQGRPIPASHPQEVIPGDAAVFRIGAGHIAIVEKIESGMVHTIDGNVSNMVSRRVRPLSQVYGFVHMSEKAVPVKVKPPVFEVVSGLNGKVIYVSGARAVGQWLARFLLKHPGTPIKIRERKVS